MAPKRCAEPTAEQVEKIKAVFASIDLNHDGTLSYDELKQLLFELNAHMSVVQVQKLYHQIDKNKNGKIEVEEFIKYIFWKTGGKNIPKPKADEAPAPAASQDESLSKVTEQWKQDTIDAHNAKRGLHQDTPPLEWSDECYISAKKQCDECQRISAMQHGTCGGPSGRHGQNIYWSSGPTIGIPSSADDAVAAWYSEIDEPGYDFEQPGYGPGIGHFTQVVWKGTQKVGMAMSDDGCFIIANYFPGGNVTNAGYFEANVQRLK
eukprot:gb/GFBE01046489.1/.p1 GENE.gb/GFBE01046489.1/~~gb/GFBE01046489.1/.p1  ORF type:complete len:263 (+),score=71.13 gb/GFBE01046489.1/:1-789(+)